MSLQKSHRYTENEEFLPKMFPSSNNSIKIFSSSNTAVTKTLSTKSTYFNEIIPVE
jgi:hypothetical protein